MKTREHVIASLPLYTLLAAYFLTAVLGNLLYLTPLGRELPALSIRGFDWSQFEIGFGAAFWFLLLVPFVAVPLLSLMTRAALRAAVARAKWLTTDIPAALYGAILVALYTFVIWRLSEADAWTRLVSAKDAIEAVNNRFEIIAAVGTKGRICLMSLLVFLAVYSCVKASRRGGLWIAIAALNVVMMMALLTLTAMKWPLVLFIFTLGGQTFVTAQRWALAKSAGVIAAGVAAYLLISVTLLKMIPDSPPIPLSEPRKDCNPIKNGGDARSSPGAAAPLK
jgi:hypothetical protein